MPELTRRGAATALAAVGASVLVAGAGSAAEPVRAEDLKDSEAKLKLRQTTRRWVHRAGFETLDAVVQYANLNPPQVAGELVVIPVAGKFDALLFM